jgi:hypothetical protein
LLGALALRKKFLIRTLGKNRVTRHRHVENKRYLSMDAPIALGVRGDGCKEFRSVILTIKGISSFTIQSPQ